MSSTIPQTSEACCSIPAVQSSYIPKGTSIKMGNYTDIYTVGDETSTTAVVGQCFLFSSLFSLPDVLEVIATLLLQQ